MRRFVSLQKKLLIIAGVLLMAGGLIGGVWAQGSLQEQEGISMSSSTPQVRSGDELRVGDGRAPDSPVRVMEGSAVSLPRTDLGDVAVEGQGIAGARPEKGKLDAQVEHRQAPTPQVRSGDELRVGDGRAPDSPVRVTEGSAVSLPRTDLGDVAVEGQGITGARPEKGKLDAQVEHRQAEMSPLGAVPINGVLAPYTAHLYGPYWYDAGTRVTLSVAWAPGTSPLRIGLTSQQTGIFYGCEISGGAGNCTAHVLQAGWYYPTVWNASASTISYSGYVSW